MKLVKSLRSTRRHRDYCLPRYLGGYVPAQVVKVLRYAKRCDVEIMSQSIQWPRLSLVLGATASCRSIRCGLPPVQCTTRSCVLLHGTTQHWTPNSPFSIPHTTLPRYHATTLHVLAVSGSVWQRLASAKGGQACC